MHISSADANVYLVNTATPVATGVDLRLNHARNDWPQRLRPGHASNAKPTRKLGVALFTLLVVDQFFYAHFSLWNGNDHTTDHLSCQFPILVITHKFLHDAICDLIAQIAYFVYDGSMKRDSVYDGCASEF